MKTVLDLLTEIRPEFDFTENLNFIDEGMLDSFDLVTLVAALEENYSISINGADIVPDNFSSLDAIEKLRTRSKGKI